MQNTPYESNNDVFPRVLGLTTIGTVGFGLYKYNTSEEFKSTVKETFDKYVSRVEREKRSVAQEDIHRINTGIKRGEAKARAINPSLRTAKVKENLDKGIGYDFSPISTHRTSRTKSIDLNEIKDIFGNKIADKIEERFVERLGVNSNAVLNRTMEGSTLKLEIMLAGGKETFSIPMFMQEGKNWINRSATSASVGKLVNKPIKNAKGEIVSRLVDPNTNILMALDNDRALEYYLALSKGGKDAVTGARDKLGLKSSELAEYHIKKPYELKRALNMLVSTSTEKITGYDIGREAAIVGKEILLDPIAAYDMGIVSVAGSNISSFAGRTIEGASLIEMAQHYRDKSHKIRFGKYNDKTKVLAAIGDTLTEEQKLLLGQIDANIHSNLSHGQVAEGTASYFQGFADMNAPESLKSLKGYIYSRDPNNIEFNSAYDDLRINQKARTTQLYNNPNLLDEDLRILEDMARKGSVNVPMQISPFHSDAIQLSKELRDMKISKPISIKLNELAVGHPNNESSELIDIFKRIEEDPNYRVPEGTLVEVRKGDILGRKLRSENIRNLEEYNLSMESEMEVVTAPYNIKIKSEHINAMIEEKLSMPSSTTWKLYGDYVDKQIKVGSPYGSTRASIAPAEYNPDFIFNSKRILEEAREIATEEGLAIVPEAEMSFDLFKNILPSITDKKNIYGKGRGEYSSFLRGVISGNLFSSSADYNVSGDMKDLFLEHTNLSSFWEKYGSSSEKAFRELENINIGRVMKEYGGLTFTRPVNRIGRTVLDLQKMAAYTTIMHEEGEELSNITHKQAEEFFTKRFAAMRDLQNYPSHMIRGKDFGELPEEIQGNINLGRYSLSDIQHSKLNYFAPIMPHEAQDITLGKGEGIFRIKAMDLSYMYDKPASLEEMAISNQIATTKLSEETDLMRRSLSSNFTGENIEAFEKSRGIKLQVLTQEEMQNKLGPYLSLSNEASNAIRDPEILLNSIFGSDNNANGFLFKTLDQDGRAGHFYMPSGEWFGGTMRLQDGTFVPAKDDAYTVARALAYAAETDGVIKGRTLEELIKTTGENYASNMRSASMHIEGRMYDKLIDNQFLVDTHRELSILKTDTAKEIDYLLGNVMLSSPKEHTSVLARKIENAITFGESKKMSMLESLDTIYGEDNMISEHIKRTAGSQNLSPLEIASNMTQESVDSWNNIKTIMHNPSNATDETLERVKTLLFNNGSAETVTRYPVIYPGSTLSTVGFASDDIAGRNIAAGHVLKTMMNADTDGDAMNRVMNIMKMSREEAKAHIGNENRIAYDYMTQISENKILKSLTGEKNIYGVVQEDAARTYNKFIESLELEGVMAAKITKGVTGISQVRAWAQQGYYHDLLLRNKELSEEAALKARYFLDTIITKSGPQSIISAKLAKAMEDKQTAEAITSISSVFSNIGTITKDSIDTSIREIGEVHTLVEQAINEVRNNSRFFKEQRILNQDGFLEDIMSIHDLQWKWAPVRDEERIASIYKRNWFNRDNETLPEFKERFLKLQEGEIFWTEVPELQEAGFSRFKHYMDFLQEPLKHNSKATESYIAVQRAAQLMLDGNKPNGTRYFEDTYLRAANKMIEESNIRKTIGMDMLREEGLRATKAQEKRIYPVVDKVIEKVAKHMTPKNIAIGAGVGMLGFAAMNLLSGDGAPEELNDLPSYNNPTFNDTRYNNMSHNRTVLEDSHNTNITTGLLTNQSADRGFLMSHINNIVGSRGYNSSTIISDGSSPYKQDMYQYGA